MFEIPLTNKPNQRFRCIVPIDGLNKDLLFNIRYNSEAEYWCMTLTDGITGKLLVDSVPLLAGKYPSANLLEQYSYLNIGSAVIIKVSPDITEENPNDSNLGTGFKLIWSDTI